MATIYLSSTYVDLKECRERVNRALVRLNHKVVAMESYVARDDRTIDACLKDVAQCDVYVGLFAHRYGFIPNTPDNPQSLSITELELRKAEELGKPCLIFVQDPNAPWPPAQMDSQAGHGERIAKLRESLGNKHTPLPFRGTEDIGELVATSVTVRLGEPDAAPVAPDPRQLGGDCLLLHSPADAADAQLIASSLQQQRLRVRLAPKALFSSTPEEFEALDAEARVHQSALVYVTANSLSQYATRMADMTRVYALLEARTSCLLVLRHPLAPALPAELAMTKAMPVDPADPSALQFAAIVTELQARNPTLRARAVVGLPIVVAAMTRNEAIALQQNPKQVGDLLTANNLARFEELRLSLESAWTKWPERYAESRADWKPFGRATSLREMIDTVVARLNSTRAGVGAQRKIKVQYYPIDPVVTRDPLLRNVYGNMARSGCVAIVDELSLFHPAIRPQIQALLNQSQVSVMTVAPVAAANTFEDLLEAEARRQLVEPFNRWQMDFDPQCEFGVEEEHHLRRWLHRSLPETMRQVRQPGPDQERLAGFRKQLGVQRQGYDEALFPPGEDR